MKCRPTFSEFLQASIRAWHLKRADECVLSLALPVQALDPLVQLPALSAKQEFSFLWDRSPGLCMAAAGKCQNFELVGQKRFQLAQRFTNETLDRLVDVTPEAPAHAKPRILLAFTFFEQTPENKIDLNHNPAVQAVLPSWQLTRQSGLSWLRLNAVVAHDADVRDFVEQVWLMHEKLASMSNQVVLPLRNSNSGITLSSNWQNNYRLLLAKGIDLVNSEELEKLVLAVTQSVVLKEPVDPLRILANLRNEQKGSCRFLWKRCQAESFFGASPERLLSIRHGRIRSDALAGTALIGQGDALCRSEKDLREHQLVVDLISNQMIAQGLEPFFPRSPRLVRHGHLVHLHTPITAKVKGNLPLELAGALHPTPAVAGLPRHKAVKWLRTLEQFDRGNYAAPLGWIDDSGNAEFRVAIRCCFARDQNLDLMAGAGLVRGSIVDKELEEVRLKLAVMTDQIFAPSEFSGKLI